MRYNTSVQYGRKWGDGAVEISDNQIIIYHKSAAIHYAFGAIGTALAHGKEILRFDFNNVNSYDIIEHVFSDELRINLMNGESVTIGLKNDLRVDLLPLIEKAVLKNSEERESEPTETKALNDSDFNDSLSQEKQTVDAGTNMGSPLFVQGEEGLKRYLPSLRTEQNEAISWDLQSTYSVKDIGHVRAYKATTAKGYYRTLFVSLNGTSNPTSAPKGFRLVGQTAPLESSRPSKVVFCRKCGTQLVEGSSFCRKCGTPIHTLVEPIDKKPNSDLIIDVQNKNLNPKIRRAFLFIEDAEWERADVCLEEALDLEPTNAYAYFGKVMISYKSVSISELKQYSDVLLDDKNYQKAIRFAEKDLANKFLSLLDTN